MNAPLVSVLIPVHNGEASIAETLASVFEQGHRRLQVVVVDNGSSDSTAAIVEDCFANAPCDCLLTGCNEPGANRARNAAFELARGDFVQWLDADDQIHPEKIERQLAAFAGSDDADITVGDWIWRVQVHDTDPRQIRSQVEPLGIAAAWGERRWRQGPAFVERQFVQPSRLDFLLRQLEDKWSPPNSYLLRREAAARLHATQAWFPTARLCQDREYFTAAALLGMKCLPVRGAWARYNYWSSGQMTRQADARERAAALASCFRRLRAISGSLDAAHRALFDQNRGLWRPLRAPLGEHGRTADSKLEQVVAAAMSKASGQASLERWAKVVTSSIAPLWERHTEVLGILTRLADLGALSLEWDPAGSPGIR